MGGYCASSKRFVLVVVSWPGLLNIFWQSECNWKHYWSNKWMSEFWVLSSLELLTYPTTSNLTLNLLTFLTISDPSGVISLPHPLWNYWCFPQSQPSLELSRTTYEKLPTNYVASIRATSWLWSYGKGE